jgi:glycosyltransferase involved in cell wall biosynthesis
LRIGIYPANLAVCGGGEKYIGKIAEILSRENDVAFLVPEEPNLEKLESRLKVDLHAVAIERIGRPSLPGGRQLPKIFKLRAFAIARRVAGRTKKYDLFINQEHGSFVPSHAARSVLVCEVPPVGVLQQHGLFVNLFFDPKAKTYDTIVVNSNFTKSWAERYYRRETIVLYPPVETESFIPLLKGRIVLSAGRFSTSLHCKKQLEMVRAFVELCAEQQLVDWEYHLVGVLEDPAYFEACKRVAKGYPVFFHTNASFEELRGLYGRAKIFWHATGLGEIESEHPELMEHFGITTVEAMSAGCVPVVIRRGGQPEIVRNTESGFLFDSIEELKEHTLRLMKDNALWQDMSEECIRRSREFSLDNFEKRVRYLFEHHT